MWLLILGFLIGLVIGGLMGMMVMWVRQREEDRMTKHEFKIGKKWYRLFDDWSEAFDYCRMHDKPTRVVIIEDDVFELWVLFPSGSGTFIRGVEKGK